MQTKTEDGVVADEKRADTMPNLLVNLVVVV